LGFRPEASADIAEAFSWYEERRAGLGAEFEAEFDRTLGYIAGSSRHEHFEELAPAGEHGIEQLRSRATSAVTPASSFASLQAAPLGRTATSNRSFATSTPTTTGLPVIAPPQNELVAVRPCTMRACDPGQLSVALHSLLCAHAWVADSVSRTHRPPR
jgi:hypothetical protein